MWMPALQCPVCRLVAANLSQLCPCRGCGQRFPQHDRIVRLASPARLVRDSIFLEQYRRVRQADGHGRRTTAVYRSLPDVSSTDPTAAEWRIRRESFDTICRIARLVGGAAKRVLDIGAGTGWLSNRLAQHGHEPVAVDLNDDEADGLGACQAYAEQFPLVQAHFDALPFAAGQFDLVVLNAALHYSADPAATLREAARMRAAGAVLLVADSPTFRHEQDGEAMVRQQLDRFRSRYEVREPVRPGVGFLTFDWVKRSLADLGLTAEFFASRGPIGWQLRRLWSRRRLGRMPAAFGVWVAR